MHVLVIGGTTFLGRAIVEALLAANHEVAVFSRGHRRPAFFDRIEHIAGDRDATDCFARLANRPFDAVVDNIAYGPAHVRAALDALHGLTGRYLFTSSAAVYCAGSGTLPAHEDDVDHGVTAPPDPLPRFPKRPPDDWRVYAMGKLHAEREVIRESRVATTIVRPSIVIGPDDIHKTAHYYFGRLLDGGLILLADGGEQLIHPGYVGDVARGVVRAIERPVAENRVYNLAQDRPLRLADWLEAAAASIGRAVRLLPVAADVAREAGVDHEPWSFRGSFAMDVERSQRELGLQATPVAHWLEETLTWCSTHGVGNTAVDPRRAEELDFASRNMQSL